MSRHNQCGAILLRKGHRHNARLAFGHQPRYLRFEGGDELIDGHQGGVSTTALFEFDPAGLEGTRANGET